MHNLMVVEHIDIARRAEGMAPIHVLQVASPLTKVSRSTRPTGDEKTAKGRNVRILLKLFSSWGRVEFQRCGRWREQTCLRGYWNAMESPRAAAEPLTRDEARRIAAN